jgi:hypothetical protein
LKALLMRQSKSDDHASLENAPTTATARTKRLAEALLADRNRMVAHDHSIIPCRVCDCTFVYKGRRGDLNGRFCSMRCQGSYDAGNNGPTRSTSYVFGVALPVWTTVAGSPETAVGVSYYGKILDARPAKYRGDRDGHLKMRQTSKGFMIPCASCGKEFDSNGLRCCSTECERRYCERQQNLEIMAQVGIAATAKRHCAACGARIPMWRKGRKVSSKTRFCSPKCRESANRAAA